MKTVAMAAAVGAVLVSFGLTACSTSAAAPQPTVITQAAAESDDPTVQAAGTSPAAFGERRSVDGLVVEVSAPRSITPSDTAYPASKRAVAFEVTVTNAAADDFRTDRFQISATTDGHTARQVVDSTQGYTGSSDMPATLAPGKAAHVTIAFAAPSEPVAVELRVEPADTSGGIADFAGQA